MNESHLSTYEKIRSTGNFITNYKNKMDYIYVMLRKYLNHFHLPRKHGNNTNFTSDCVDSFIWSESNSKLIKFVDEMLSLSSLTFDRFSQVILLLNAICSH